ncbi:hypothetical protein ACRALDRAFT_2109196 [Sodiomyces alcalophilus JCM 7366]|uniref:uncharacterized protein n=1 Tax=Sodiomyces alcalophilus JCM 7366 TaxID=591952 RepID=UPI0039B39E69
MVRSIPLLSFADGFSLYRNIHKSIIGIYLFIAPLESRYRNHQHNIIPLILGPYRSNSNSVWKAISGYLRDLEEGIYY